jgi:epsin
MAIIDKRLNDHGKNWRHVFKSLTLLDYLVHAGSEQVIRYAKDRLYVVKTLREFQHIDDQGRDQGANVRQKAKLLTALLMDDERLQQERKQRNYMEYRMNGQVYDDNALTVAISTNRNIGSSQSDSGYVYYDEDADLRRAIEESKKTAAAEQRRRANSEEDLQRALRLSEQEAREKQKLIAAQNESVLTEDWQQRGISSSAIELFGGPLEDYTLTAPTQPFDQSAFQSSGYEQNYGYATMHQNNPFGNLTNAQPSQPPALTGPPSMLAIQGPNDTYNYAQSEYGGSTMSSTIDAFSTISGGGGGGG